MNIQYLFHNGDIIDDQPNVREWEQADAAYRMLDEAGVPYGILAGNHDVGGLRDDYSLLFRLLWREPVQPERLVWRQL